MQINTPAAAVAWPLVFCRAVFACRQHKNGALHACHRWILGATAALCGEHGELLERRPPRATTYQSRWWEGGVHHYMGVV